MLSPTPHAEPERSKPKEPKDFGEDRRLTKGLGWYVTFFALALLLFIGIGVFTGVDAIGASARFLWNALAAVFNSAVRAAGGLLALLAKGIGWRRLSRIATTIMGVGLSYSGGVILSDRGLQRAKGWTGKLKALFATLRRRWLALPLVWKLAIVATLIASQLYLHFLLILFPIAFLVPVVRRLWVRGADLLVGSWYWKAFGRRHRAAVAFLRRQPGVRHVIGATRLARIRYLRAWRLWKYDPRYRSPETGKHEVSFIEPVRLWWRGELDGYVGRHLLCGRSRARLRGPRGSRYHSENLVEERNPPAHCPAAPVLPRVAPNLGATMPIDVKPLAIPEVKLITPPIFRDPRGFFSETYNRDALAAAGIEAEFVQDNQSLSRARGVLRGLHFQTDPHPQGKLVRVVRGSIFDVAVDIRRGSPTYGRHVSATLSADNWAQVWVPTGFAHAFCTLEPDTEVIYKVTDFYAPECEHGLAFDDPDLGIAWPVAAAEVILSDKDRRNPRLRDLPAYFTHPCS